MLQSPTPELMRQQNRAIILAAIQEQGPISRVELASLLGLNPATITRITRDLIDDGLVKEKGEGESKGAGRKRILLQFNHSARLVIGIHADSRQVTAVIANLATDFLQRRTALLSPSLTLPIVSSLIDELLEDNPSHQQCLAAICLSTHTKTDGESLVEELQQRFRVPVIAWNTVTVTAVGEAEVGGMNEQPVFVLFYLGSKSYSCLYLNGEVRIGELGLSQNGQPLSARLCDSGLIETFGALVADGVPSAVSINSVRSRLIFEAARRDDPAALQAVEKIADDLAFAAMWTRTALDITHVVIGGSWLRAIDVLMPLLEVRLNRWSATAPNISAAKLGDEASLIGAVRMAIRIAEPV